MKKLVLFVLVAIIAFGCNKSPTAPGNNQHQNGAWTVTEKNLIDPDSNSYTMVTIGTQVWTVENLKTTKFNDGTAIPLAPDYTVWTDLTTPGYCWFENNAANKANYGALYNWWAVHTGKLAPAGWHVPTDADWTTLSNYLDGGSEAGAKMKDTETTLWTQPNVGATNSSGFSALPGGFRYYGGGFSEKKTSAGWWSSTEYSVSLAWYRILYYDASTLNRVNDYRTYGLSVRLVKD
jgi:uncharacterized protein (TIGR02145 family)